MKPRESKKEAIDPEETTDRQQTEKSVPDEFCHYCEYRDTCREK